MPYLKDITNILLVILETKYGAIMSQFGLDCNFKVLSHENYKHVFVKMLHTTYTPLLFSSYYCEKEKEKEKKKKKIML